MGKIISKMHHLNVEIKARCTNPEQITSRLLENGARFVGEDHQIDTYFNIAQGRLKLREGNIENALILYHRNNQAGPKKSDVILYESSPGSSLKTILTAALGILAIVEKQRAIFFIDNVKFHVDKVMGLGNFIEIEAINSNGVFTEAALLAQCRHYMAFLNIDEHNLLEISYSDMIIGKA